MLINELLKILDSEKSPCADFSNNRSSAFVDQITQSASGHGQGVCRALVVEQKFDPAGIIPIASAAHFIGYVPGHA